METKHYFVHFSVLTELLFGWVTGKAFLRGNLFISLQISEKTYFTMSKKLHEPPSPTHHIEVLLS